MKRAEQAKGVLHGQHLGFDACPAIRFLSPVLQDGFPVDNLALMRPAVRLLNLRTRRC